jgi:hypothetical protein
MNVKVGRRYTCSWPNGEVRRVTVDGFLQNKTLVNVSWYESCDISPNQIITIPMDETVPVSWITNDDWMIRMSESAE